MFVNTICLQDYNMPPPEPLPRVFPKDEDPSLVKRNKRMLGQLLGTLEVICYLLLF
jgi:pinin